MILALIFDIFLTGSALTIGGYMLSEQFKRGQRDTSWK